MNHDIEKAYQYITAKAKSMSFTPSIKSDESLAKALDVPLVEITSLKKGIRKPSKKLVASFKKLIGSLYESEVDSYLVEPFERRNEKPR